MGAVGLVVSGQIRYYRAMKFIDLQTPYELARDGIDAAIGRVLDHGQYVMGPEVATLEQQLASFVGAPHCVATASGTTALQIALMALDIGPGDEVVTTPFSFFGTAEAILLLGAKPVFVDIDPDTYNMDASLLSAAISNRTKAIMPVSLYGQCADYDKINAVAAAHGLAVIEDAAQSFGATYKGRYSCSLTTIATTSFFPSKPLGCYGDGGACFTADDQLAAKMRQLINHGQNGRYNHELVGINGRFDSLQAAILLEKLKFFAGEITARQQVAQWYNQALQAHVKVPRILPENVSVYAQYTIAVRNREQLQASLRDQGIPTAIHYPVPLHRQPVMKHFIDHTPFAIAEAAAKQVISLPFHPYLSKAAVAKVTGALLPLMISPDHDAT